MARVLNKCFGCITLVQFKKSKTMKYFIALFLLLSGSMYSQEQVFNVQRYCVDEVPFKSGECDISGNEYSFVFLDEKRMM
jgi:hypothetical protein